jgi:hypothetical protein
MAPAIIERPWCLGDSLTASLDKFLTSAQGVIIAMRNVSSYFLHSTQVKAVITVLYHVKAVKKAGLLGELVVKRLV